MYETEAATNEVPPKALSDAVKVQFRDFDAKITAVALIPWEEHCTECAIPSCYSTCDLYSPRKDGRCRRFVGGFTPIPDVPSLSGYAVRVELKRWAQLMAYANRRLVPLKEAQRAEQVFRAAGRWAAWLPDGKLSIAGRRAPLTQSLRVSKQTLTRRGWLARTLDECPDYFLVEAYNPQASPLNLTLVMRDGQAGQGKVPFQKRLEFPHGFTRHKIDYAHLRAVVHTAQDLRIDLSPSISENEGGNPVLYLGTITFVKDAAYAAAAVDAAAARPAKMVTAKAVKIVAWDLDNTIWRGILVEDGPEGIRLRESMREVMETLDRRGIVSTVVSKNDHEHAMAQLDRFGLADLVVFPQISWLPKSEAFKRLIDQFNVGEDTFAFIDDSPFERAQVAEALPEVRVYPETVLAQMLELPEFSPETSSESSKRRAFYQAQRQRNNAQRDYLDDYLRFLRESEIRLTVFVPDAASLDRVQELIQRTNQMNFSGTRYTREQIESILGEVDRYDAYAMQCEDRFGSYGTVGFGLVERETPLLKDLTFSCRVQAKRVEHAFFTFLLNRYKLRGHQTFFANYRESERNAAVAAVFSDLGFAVESEEGETTLYRYSLSHSIPDDGIITVQLRERQ